MQRLVVVCAVIAGAGCVDHPKHPDKSDQLFQRDLLEISIDMDPVEWDAMRHQAKTKHGVFGMANCRDHPVPNPYTWFAATVTVDGVAYPTTGIRKKGHIGSQSTQKPSLKLELDHFVDGQNVLGIDRLALNNSKSDPSFARTCVAYAVFAEAGIPAPRCTLAHVTVNGTDLGAYVVVDELKHQFLERSFADATGNLYEGQTTDFRPEFIGGFEAETNPDVDPTHADLHAVMDVLETATDADLLAALAPLVDLDEFYRYWAVEGLLAHRDSYSGNANNFFVYADPGRGGRFVFLPWDPDATLQPDTNPDAPDSVFAYGRLAYRLYAIPEARARYYAELDALLADVWRPRKRKTDAAHIADLVRPILDEDFRAAMEDGQDELASVIDGRAGAIAAARAGGDPAWTAGMRILPCRIPVGPVTGTFTTSWGTQNQSPLFAGTGTLDVMLDAVPLTITQVGARAGHLDGRDSDQLVMWVELAGGKRLAIGATYPSDDRFFELYTAVGSHPLVGPPVNMSLVEQDTSTNPPTALRRYEIGEGVWTYDAVEARDGAPVRGHFEATLYTAPGE